MADFPDSPHHRRNPKHRQTVASSLRTLADQGSVVYVQSNGSSVEGSISYRAVKKGNSGFYDHEGKQVSVHSVEDVDLSIRTVYLRGNTQ